MKRQTDQVWWQNFTEALKWVKKNQIPIQFSSAVVLISCKTYKRTIGYKNMIYHTSKSTSLQSSLEHSND